MAPVTFSGVLPDERNRVLTDIFLPELMGTAILILLGCGVVAKEQLTRTIASIKGVNGNVLGVVVNRIPTRGANAETYYYGEGYAPLSPDRSRRERTKDRQHVRV